MTTSSFRTSRAWTVILGLAACLVVSFIIVYPDRILASSLEGLSIWWKIVFPALLPFLIIVEMMSALGVMHFIGTMLDPAMQRLFRLPGSAGWCVAVGWTAGAPASAQQIAELRRSRRLTRLQAELLFGLAHAGSPALIVIVIAAGFLSEPKLGLPLLVVHWLGAMIAAFAVFGLRRDPEQAVPLYEPYARGSGAPATRVLGLWRRSMAAMEEARRTDGRAFGRLLGDSVFDAIQKLMIIGGYMIFFSVIVKIVMLSGRGPAQALIDLAAAAFPEGGGRALVSGLFEQHLGTFAFHVQTADVWTLAGLSALLGWSGLSLHAQARAAAARTDMRYYPFLLTRLLHAASAGGLTLLLFPRDGIQPSPVIRGFQTSGGTINVWAEPGLLAPAAFPDAIELVRLGMMMSVLAGAMLAVLAVLSAIIESSRSHRSR